MNRLDEYIEKMYSLKYFIRLPVRKITFSHLTNTRMCLKMVLLTWLHALNWILWQLYFLTCVIWPTVNELAPPTPIMKKVHLPADGFGLVMMMMIIIIIVIITIVIIIIILLILREQ